MSRCKRWSLVFFLRGRLWNNQVLGDRHLPIAASKDSGLSLPMIAWLTNVSQKSISSSVLLDSRREDLPGASTFQPAAQKRTARTFQHPESVLPAWCRRRLLPRLEFCCWDSTDACEQKVVTGPSCSKGNRETVFYPGNQCWCGPNVEIWACFRKFLCFGCSTAISFSATKLAEIDLEFYRFEMKNTIRSGTFWKFCWLFSDRLLSVVMENKTNLQFFF